MNMYIVKVYQDDSETFTGKLFSSHTAASMHYMELLIKYGVDDDSTGLVDGVRVDMPEHVSL
jgi:hypothetical protein